MITLELKSGAAVRFVSDPQLIVYGLGINKQDVNVTKKVAGMTGKIGEIEYCKIHILLDEPIRIGKNPRRYVSVNTTAEWSHRAFEILDNNVTGTYKVGDMVKISADIEEHKYLYRYSGYSGTVVRVNATDNTYSVQVANSKLNGVPPMFIRAQKMPSLYDFLTKEWEYA